MNSRTGLIAVATAAALLGACASTPKATPEVVAAREAVQRVASDPLGRQVAAAQIDAAQGQLLIAEKQTGPVRDQAVFETNRNAEIAAALVRTARAHQQAEETTKQRAQVLMDSREREAATARAQAQAAAAQAQAAAAQAASANSQADQLRSQAEQLRQQLADMHAQQTDRGMVLTLPDVLFDSGRSTLNPGANSAIDQVATFLRANGTFSVRIEGHTDSIGTAEYNQTLSEQRAGSVREALLSRGVQTGQVIATGKGLTQPVASNATAAGRQQNRRVEIVFSDAQGKFASSGR